MRLSRLMAAALAGLALLSAGCLDFDKQTLILTYDGTKDEAHGLLLYEGLQVTGEGDESVKRARETFERFFVTGKSFYLGHPMVEPRLEAEKPIPGDKRNPRGEKAQKLVIDHVTVGERTLFPGKDGVLSGMQVVQVKQARKFLAGLNELISEGILEDVEKRLANAAKPGSKVDVETLKIQQKAAQDRHEWLRFEPGRLSIHLVGTPKSFEAIKRDMLNDMILQEVQRLLDPPRAQGKPPADPAEILQRARGRVKEVERLVDFFSAAPLSIDLRKDRATIAIGLGDTEPIRIFSPYMPEKPGRPGQVVDLAKEFKVTMLKETTRDSVIADFLKKYPPKK